MSNSFNIVYTSFKTYEKKSNKFEKSSVQEHKAFLELMELEDTILHYCITRSNNIC